MPFLQLLLTKNLPNCMLLPTVVGPNCKVSKFVKWWIKQAYNTTRHSRWDHPCCRCWGTGDSLSNYSKSSAFAWRTKWSIQPCKRRNNPSWSAENRSPGMSCLPAVYFILFPIACLCAGPPGPVTHIFPSLPRGSLCVCDSHHLIINSADIERNFCG